MPACKGCSQNFEITDADRDFYDRASPVINDKKYAIPEPTLCPACRQRRRLAFYNRRQLYKRTGDFDGQPIISIYSADKPFKVYPKEIYYSDQWDPLEYGQDFDFNRPFFEQFRELMEKVPCLALTLLGENLNSDYNNDNYKLKNCYLVFDGTDGQDCYYGETFVKIQDSVDFKYLEKSELCYECVNCANCYNLKYSRFCKNCNDSWFLKDCIGCSSCFGCVNLRQKEFHIFNKPYSKEEYLETMKKFTPGSYKSVQEMKQKAEEFFITQPVKATHGVQNQNVKGDNLNHCKNAYYCYDSNYLEDCEFVNDDQTGCKDCYDIDVWGEAMELCYNCCVVGMALRNVIGGFYVSEGGHDIYYSIFCSRNSDHLLGCIGLRHHQCCIFNKQYKREEYDELAGKIIEHMQKTGEWGEYFPPEISYFGYNETVAQDYFPMTKDEVLAKKWQWKDQEEKMPDVKKTVSADQIPDHIKDIPDEIIDWAIKCEKSGKPYRIVKQELKFYRDHGIPLPHLHPDERHLARIALRNPHHLWKRKCAKCGADIETTFAPERKEIVYCEKCYQEAVE